MVGVLDKIDFLVRFWELRARSERMGNPLESSEQVELLSLMQLVTTPHAQTAGPVARDGSAIPAQVIGDGEIRTIEIRGVTAAAILVASSSALTVGARVILLVADAVTGIELALPCVVTWAFRGSPCTMALAVDGIPTRNDFVTSAAGAGATPSIRFGARARVHAID